MGSVIQFYLAILIIGFVVIKDKKISFCVTLFGYFLAVIDLLSYKMLKHHIDYFTLSRIDWSMIEMAKDVVPKYFYGSIFVTVLVILICWYLSQNIHAATLKNRKISVLIFCLSVIMVFTSKTSVAYKNIVYSAFKMNKYEFYSLSDVLVDLKSSKQYKFNEDIVSLKGKNLVFIYCESLENGFLNKNDFPVEMPMLTSLVEKGWYSFTNYKCLPGSSWTVGALYATQTSLPAFFTGVYGKGHKWMEAGGNNIFKSVSQTKAVSWASVLEKAGYKNLFLSSGDLDFAGTGNIMRLLGYKTKDFKSILQSKNTAWGMHDYDLFEMAKKEYDYLKNTGEPFNLTLLTVDTHFPKGIPDGRMKNLVNTGLDKDSHEFTLATIDYLIGDFVEYIERNDFQRDTVIVICGDHLMMGDSKTTPIVQKLDANSRRILFMTNQKTRDYGINDEVAFFDIPHIVLNLLGVEHNAYFSRDLFEDMSEEFILNNKEQFAILNSKLN